MPEEKKIHMLEDLFEMEEGSLSIDKKLVDIDNYDSMTKLSLIILMQDEFNVVLKSDDIKSFVTIKDIVDRMR